MKNKKINYTNTQNNEQSMGKHSPERTKKRPTSPHIDVYKWEWTMIYSIAHRISAVGVGLIMLIILIGFTILKFSLLSESIVYVIFMNITRKFYDLPSLLETYPLAKIFYMGSVICISYYIFATIKYMVWGTANGLKLHQAKWLGHASIIATILFSVGVFINANIL